MTTRQIGEKTVTVDKEGFLNNYDDWDQDFARSLADDIGIELTDEHLKILEFLRVDYAQQGETPTLRRVSTVGGFATKSLFMLFPKKPARKMSYIAGLPKPAGCI